MCVSITSQIAACEALHSGKKLVEEMKREYRRRREFIIEGLNNIGLTCQKPQGAFYAFPSIKKTGLKSLEFAQKLLKEEKVAVVPGTAFGPSTGSSILTTSSLRADGEQGRTIGEGFEDYIRISYASSFDNLKEALRRMSIFLKK